MALSYYTGEILTVLLLKEFHWENCLKTDLTGHSPSFLFTWFSLNTDFTLPHSLVGKDLVRGKIHALGKRRVAPSFPVKLVQDESSPRSLHPWINPHPHSRSFLLLSSSLLPSVTSKALNINLCYDISF